MDVREAKEIVVQAGKKLTESGLITRTWGNVSCRISPDQFVITPSGRAYETLTPDEIVVVDIEDCSYEGDVEPSSEKGVHAEGYRLRAEINFIIHTHQLYASVVSPLGLDIKVTSPAAAALLGSQVNSIPYGPPGSEMLKRNVAAALSESDGKAYLMVSHGTLCLGKDCEEAFRLAAELEKISVDFINQRYLEASGCDLIDPLCLSDYIVSLHTRYKKEAGIAKPQQFGNSERTKNGFKLYLYPTEKDPFPQYNGNIIEVNLNNCAARQGLKGFPPAAVIHCEIYRKHSQINAVIQTTLFDILTISRIGLTICPYLDDFAQIIGVNVQTIKKLDLDNPATTALEIAKKLKGRNAVLLNNNGALCCGPTKSDAVAAVMIMEKNCKAFVAASLFGRGKPINFLECRLMRHNYLKSYSLKVLAK